MYNLQEVIRSTVSSYVESLLFFFGSSLDWIVTAVSSFNTNREGAILEA